MLKKMIFAGALMAAGTMMAQAHPQPGAFLEKADANQDGMIVRDEFLAMHAEQFARLDANGDSFLDEADRAARAAAAPQGANKQHRDYRRGARMHARMDADGDGRVSKDEFMNGATARFDRLDADKNSALDAQEIAAAKERGRKMQRRGSKQERAQNAQ
ncbi:MAG TPA: hypothetical protein VK025_08375 [Steroidobacter sp.]|nr:hypothetical protein [Steroidobacter sp.]